MSLCGREFLGFILCRPFTSTKTYTNEPQGREDPKKANEGLQCIVFMIGTTTCHKKGYAVQHVLHILTIESRQLLGILAKRKKAKYHI